MALGRRRILVVEDHADTALLLARVLSNWGFEVVNVESVAAAMQTAAGGFDILICDLQLPDGTGWDLMNKLRELGHDDICAIAMSGHAYPRDIARSHEAGFSKHFTKPFDMLALRDYINNQCHAPVPHSGEVNPN